MKEYEVISQGDVYKQKADYFCCVDGRCYFYKDNSTMRDVVYVDKYGGPPTPTFKQSADEVLATYPGDAIVRKIA